MAERGVEATGRLMQVIRRRIKPTAAWRKPPLLPPLGSQDTAPGPMRRVVACLWDPAAVQECVKAGVGHRLTLGAGGKVGDRHGAPQRITRAVRTLSDGRRCYNPHRYVRRTHTGPVGAPEGPKVRTERAQCRACMHS